ncbi:MAG TPA: ATP-binding protein [Gemmatimonadota bacterium]|nr:ATP-binding protein [Gemmatimonadota bacterium]
MDEVLGRFRRMEWRLPLSIGGLLLVVVAVFSWSAYREVRAASLSAASSRVVQVSGQLAGTFEQSFQALIGRLRETAEDPSVAAWLASGGSASGAGARSAIDVYVDRRSHAQSAAIELWTAGGRRLLRVVDTDTAGTPAPEGGFPSWVATGPVSRFDTAGGRLSYALALPVRRDTSTVGYVVERRVVDSSSRTRELLSQLIGMQSRLLVGGMGGTWTDLAGVARPPVGRVTPGSVQTIQTAGGASRIGAGALVPGAGWSVWVDVPRSLVLARPEAFLRRMLYIGLAIVVVGALLGWLLSRRVTGPLAEVAHAAGALAAGDYGRRVDSRRRDELGELAAAFNAMARQVADAHDRLEAEVRERTLELERQTADLEATNEELEAFSYSVSHDLRAPLRAINGFSQALLEDYEDELDEEGRGYLGRVSAAADRMGELIDDLLSLSRVARTELRDESVDLGAMARDVLGELRASHPARTVEVAVDADAGARGDPELLRIALENLLENAWKFTGRRQNARIEFGVGQDGGERIFFVRDNGTGFDMAYADRLFSPFQRLHRAEEFHGTGIGLATVQRVIRRHGGSVWAESEPGRGATFCFTLDGGERSGSKGG